MPYIFEVLPPLLRGAYVTLQVGLAAAFLGILISFSIGGASLSKNVIVLFLLHIFINFFRGTSLLVQLFWIYYVLPFFGLLLSPFVSAVLGIGMNFGAYGSEIVRGAIVAVPQGQIDAAVALNMKTSQRMLQIVLPQALTRMLAPFGNLLIELLKSTALVSLVTLPDLTFQGFSMIQTLGRRTPILTLVLLIYFLLSFPISRVFLWLERRFLVVS